MANLFILNGAIPLIVAKALIEREYKADENYIILEKSQSTLVTENRRAPGVLYDRVIDLLASTVPYTHLMSVSYSRSFPSFSSRPLAYINEVRRILDAFSAIEAVLPRYFDRLIYSGNARLQIAFGGRSRREIRIEHGLGDYWRSHTKSPRRLGAATKRWVVRALTGAQENFPDEFVLADGGACRAVRENTCYGSPIKRVPPPDLARTVAEFLEIARTEEPDLYTELQSLKYKLAGGSNVFLYLPMEEAPRKNYGQILREQLQALKESEFYSSSARFFVKPHPVDTTDYSAIFAAAGLEIFTVSHPLAKFIPAEFYLCLLREAVALGCGSSSLFYAKWWLDRAAFYHGGHQEYVPGFYQDVRNDFAQDIESFAIRPSTCENQAAK